MIFQRNSLAALAAAALVTAGCSSDRFAGNTAPAVPPAAIQAAPLGQVSQSTLLPPGGGYSDAPGVGMNVQEQAQMADSGTVTPAGVELSTASVAGVWKVLIGGMNCQIATPQTKFGKGYRAGPLHCPAVFSKVNSWSVNGSQLVFYDKTGSNVATLYSSDGARFEGRTASGMPVVLIR